MTSFDPQEILDLLDGPDVGVEGVREMPRAWTPDGKPVPVNAEYQAAYYQTMNDGTRALALMGVEHPTREEAEWEREDIQRDDSETDFFIARRFITEWEEA